VLGGNVGADRELSHPPIGLRTHSLLTIGACRLTTISAYGSSSWLGAKASPWSPGPRPTIAPERLRR
jgi:uncharacterized membrane protein YhiD involved in acid resistance